MKKIPYTQKLNSERIDILAIGIVTILYKFKLEV